MTPEEADAKQDWKGVDGATAYLLIERHADGWDEVREMMHAWLRANQPVIETQVIDERANNYSKILTILGMEEKGDPVAMVEKMQATIVKIAEFME